MNSNWTLGPSLSYWNFKTRDDDNVFDEKISIKAYAFGARANWFKNGVYKDGLYLGPALTYAHAEAKVTDKTSGDEFKGTASAVVASCLVGYGWFWDSFNIMLGGGLSVPLGDRQVTVKNTTTGETEKDDVYGGFTADFSLGWTV
jgi:outer membrane autotransporter protein